MKTVFLSCALLLCCSTLEASPWVLARSAHFGVYSHEGAERVQAGLAWFEQLSRFFDRNDMIPELNLERRPPVKVIGFGSEAEYNSFRVGAMADAYYVGTQDQDYVVLPSLSRNQFGVAAHEYAHLVLRNRGFKLPTWLAEGLADVFSTVTIGAGWCEFGGEMPLRMQTLRRRAWIPLTELLALDADSAVRRERDGTDVFYAES